MTCRSSSLRNCSFGPTGTRARSRALRHARKAHRQCRGSFLGTAYSRCCLRVDCFCSRNLDRRRCSFQGDCIRVEASTVPSPQCFTVLETMNDSGQLLLDRPYMGKLGEHEMFRCLTVLDLQFQGIFDSAIYVIAVALEKNTTVQEINLSFNYLSNLGLARLRKGAQAATSAAFTLTRSCRCCLVFEKNHTILKLDLRKNEVSGNHAICFRAAHTEPFVFHAEPGASGTNASHAGVIAHLYRGELGKCAVGAAGSLTRSLSRSTITRTCTF